MKLSSDIGTAASRGAASHPPVQPTQAEDVAAPREERAPTGPLAGLASSSAALRGRRASLAGRASPHADEEGAMLGGSHRSDSSQASDASDATFYTAQVVFPAREIDTPDVPAAAATYAERSTAAAAEVKAQLRARLDALPFAAPSEEQTALQASYLEWADARVQERITAFGPDAGYQAVGDMKTAGTKAALPIAYECLRSFITGAMRTPVGLATGAAYASRRPADAEELSTAMVAGVAAGSASYTSDTLLTPAMDRRARVANLPRFQAIDPKILVPDPPPVILEITAEGKRFTRPGENNAPTLAELKAQTYDRRLGITQRQSTLDDKSLDTLLLKPVINAGFNAARRTGGEPGLLTPVGQWGLSTLAIGGAGVVQKALLETGKAMARTGQMRVPDLVGGEQRLNLFALALPDKARRPAQWSDAVHFPPSYLLDTGKEALALARQGFNSASAVATTARDLLTRHMLSNVMASFGSMGAGRIITAPLRGGEPHPCCWRSRQFHGCGRAAGRANRVQRYVLECAQGQERRQYLPGGAPGQRACRACSRASTHHRTNPRGPGRARGPGDRQALGADTCRGRACHGGGDARRAWPWAAWPDTAYCAADIAYGDRHAVRFDRDHRCGTHCTARGLESNL